MTDELANIPEQLLPLAVPIGDLTPYYRNPRNGDIPSIAESLTVNGQYRPIVVNKGAPTGRPNEILAGDHTYAAAKQLNWDRIAVTWVDVDEDAAARIVVVDNRTNDLAGYDTALLAEVLSESPNPRRVLSRLGDDLHVCREAVVAGGGADLAVADWNEGAVHDPQALDVRDGPRRRLQRE